VHSDEVSSAARLDIALQVRSTLWIELESINLPIAAHQRCNTRVWLGMLDT
jgi:hypothetical protein